MFGFYGLNSTLEKFDPLNNNNNNWYLQSHVCPSIRSKTLLWGAPDPDQCKVNCRGRTWKSIPAEFFFVRPHFPLTKCPKILFLLFCGLKSQLHSDDGHVHATPCSVRVLAYQNVMHSSSLLCSHRLYKPSAGCICVHGEHTKIPWRDFAVGLWGISD